MRHSDLISHDCRKSFQIIWEHHKIHICLYSLFHFFCLVAFTVNFLMCMNIILLFYNTGERACVVVLLYNVVHTPIINHKKYALTSLCDILHMSDSAGNTKLAMMLLTIHPYTRCFQETTLTKHNQGCIR